jgi:hypothetical protein
LTSILCATAFTSIPIETKSSSKPVSSTKKQKNKSRGRPGLQQDLSLKPAANAGLYDVLKKIDPAFSGDAANHLCRRANYTLKVRLNVKPESENEFQVTLHLLLTSPSSNLVVICKPNPQYFLKKRFDKRKTKLFA